MSTKISKDLVKIETNLWQVQQFLLEGEPSKAGLLLQRTRANLRRLF